MLPILPKQHDEEDKESVEPDKGLYINNISHGGGSGAKANIYNHRERGGGVSQKLMVSC